MPTHQSPSVMTETPAGRMPAGAGTQTHSPARGPSSAPVTEPRLSAAARMTRDGLGVPMTALPGIEREDRVYIQEHSRALNRLISGMPSDTGVWEFLEQHLVEQVLDDLRVQARESFSPLWGVDDLDALEDGGLRGLEREWRARVAAHPRWAAAAAALRGENDYAAIWRDILGGDFDLRGRGAQYTAGMEAFQASRWLGARTLVELLGTGGTGTYLDVLGGDGYVWRLMEAEKRLAETRLVLVEDARFYFDGEALPAATRDLVDRVTAIDPRVVVLVARSAGGDEYRARLISPAAGGERVSGVLTLSGAELLHLSRVQQTAWLGDDGGAAADDVAARAEEFVAGSNEAGGGALVITNDISPHMFYRAGLWGMPTREDATRLSRTFKEGSLDGILFAYGTHHIPDMFEAVDEAAAVVRPGGAIVLHDFFDEGPAGQWFHRVVDKYSRTGHDIPHIGPVQMAAVLFAAGFRDVALHEMQDPFLFACGEGETGARGLAISYLLGMYGMGESFEGKHDFFEELIDEILTYPEAGEVPLFSDTLVYIPRRAVVATARRAAPGETGYSPADRALIRRIGELLRDPAADIVRRAGAPESVYRYWFAADGSRWGVSPERQAAWHAWEQGLPVG